MCRELLNRAKAPLQISNERLEVRVHRCGPSAKFQHVERSDASLDFAHITLSALQPICDLYLGELRRLAILAQEAY